MSWSRHARGFWYVFLGFVPKAAGGLQMFSNVTVTVSIVLLVGVPSQVACPGDASVRMAWTAVPAQVW